MRSEAAIILAAGASRRFGSPKQLAQLASETLLERAVRVAREANLTPVLVVIPPGSVIATLPNGVTGVVNHEAAEGISSSIRAGLRELSAHVNTISGAVIMACDQPSVTAAHLRKLVCDSDKVLASEYSGRIGVPAYFPSTFFSSLMTLTGDKGARELLKGAASIPLELGDLDIDTIQDLNRAKELYEI